ncbi:MAG: hypothetical protein J1E64_13380 [Acetatifactor sp.]|nr:hypothetical protein [Acetatifactor sp.]
MRADDFEKQQDKAFRLLEALSDIDEELLVRSEQAGRQNRTIPLWKYGSVVAACFVLLVLSMGVYSVGRLVYGGAGTADSVDLASLKENINTSDATSKMESVLQAADTTREEDTTHQEGPDEGISGDIEKEAGKIQDAESSIKDELAEELAQDKHSQRSDGVQSSAQNAVGSSGGAADLTLEAAKGFAVVGNFVPETMPEGYRFVSATTRDVPTPYHSLNLSYISATDSKQIELVITNYYMLLDDLPEGTAVNVPNNMMGFRNVIPADEVKEETFRTEDRVAVLYDGDVIVRFGGNADPETIYQVFTSICP